LPIIFAALILALLVAASLRMGLDFWAADADMVGTLLKVRGIRVGVAIITGSALAVAGVLLQALLRNPLASPDVLGLSAGAGLGVMIAAYAAYAAGLGIAHLGLWSAPAALVGGLGALGLVYLMSQRRGLVEPVSLILVGVVVSILCGSGIEFIKHLLPDRGTAVGRLLMGSVRDVSISMLIGSGLAALIGILAAWTSARAIDAASLPEDEARSVGVHLGALRLILFSVAGVLTAASVVLTGPIGFIGLVAPHLARLLVGPSHRILIPAAAILGATIVVLADALARVIDLGSGPMPVGILTTVLGGPLFIWMLRTQMRAR